jgi:hypothetical protein
MHDNNPSMYELPFEAFPNATESRKYNQFTFWNSRRSTAFLEHPKQSWDPDGVARIRDVGHDGFKDKGMI